MAGVNDNNKERQDQLGEGVPHLFMTPNSPLQTPDVDVANNNRSRGRPLGSKNKPKKTVMVMQDNPNAFLSPVFEISAGADVVKSLSEYANRRERGINILSGRGMLADITFRQPGGNIMTLHGQYEILSISGTILPISGSILPSLTLLEGIEGLLVNLVGGQGQVTGGYVVPPLVALSPLMLVTATFANPLFDKIPLCSVNSPVTAATRLAAEDGDNIPLFNVNASAGERIMISNINHPYSSGHPITTTTTSNVTKAPPSKASPF